MEKSLKEKVFIMNDLGFRILALVGQDNSMMSEDEFEDFYAVVDGLAEEHVIKHIEGRCSLKSLGKNTPEVLEEYVDKKISSLRIVLDRVCKPSEDTRLQVKGSALWILRF